MSALFKTAITGVEPVITVFRQLPRSIQGRELVGAGRAALKVVRVAAEARAPVRATGGGKVKKRGLTGSLKGKARTPGHLSRRIVIKRARSESYNVRLVLGPAPDAFYGMFQEFGTATIAARPWLRPAFDETADLAVREFGKQFGRRVERAAIKLAGKFGKSGLARSRTLRSRTK